MIKTVLFDFDGVIADSVSSIFKWFQYAASVFNINLPIQSIHELKTNFFEPFPEFYKFLGFDWDNDREKIYHEYIAYHSLHPAVLTDGIDLVIKQLANTQGIRLGIVSSNMQSVLEQNLEYHGLDSCFDVVKGIEKDKETPLKPDPTLLLEAMTAIKAEINSTVYIGDQPSDVLTAHNASEKCNTKPMTTISICTGFATREKLQNCSPKADYIINHPSEILTNLNLYKN